MRKFTADLIDRRFLGNATKKLAKNGVICHASIPVRFSKLKARVILFDTQKNFHKTVKESSKDTMASCDPLYRNVISFDGGVEKEHELFDKRYFALLFFCLDKLSCGLIAHEACHAAFFFDQRNPHRRHRDRWWSNQELEEEDVRSIHLYREEPICYLTGEITNKIIFLFQEKGFL